MILLYFLLLATVNAEYKYETKWFEVPLDHFSYDRNETFKIKYLVNEDHWHREKGPIFFYTGNEGQIEVFAQHTGFMWDIAEEFRAKLVFAEHRYYGASMPFGNKSMENSNIGYLSSSQALADYADLINYLQGGDVTKPKYPVIAFGGSYGGMLSAYFRMKYPHIVSGAIAASAPIHMYPGMTHCGAFNNIVTSSFEMASPHCKDNIKRSWEIIRNFASSANNSDWLKKNWRLCEPVKNSSDVQALVDYLQSMYVTLAMVNYPYECDFLMPLPGQPVRTACQYLSEKLTGEELLKGIGSVINIFSNYKNNNKCVDYKNSEDTGNLDSSGWDYQACTEMIMPMCTTSKDMFEPKAWNLTAYSNSCHKQYGVYPRVDAAMIEYGGNRLQAASNIVFSNGLLDPWAAGGIIYSVSDTVVAVVMIDTAHHLDLMPKNDKDPQSVRDTRNIHKKNIRRWIRQFGDNQNNRV